MSFIEFVGRRLAPASAGAALIAVLSTTSAQAHHVMDGMLPSTFVEGLLSGLGHPIIGPDHFAFVVAVGLERILGEELGSD